MHRERNWQSPLVTALVISIFTAASVISTNQYQYGISDHAIIIPFLKSLLPWSNPIYPDDFLLAQSPFYYTYLWDLCSFLISTFNVSIPVLFFTSYCASVFFIFLGNYLIAKTLFQERQVAFLSLFFLLFSIKTLGGSVTVDNIFLTRVAVLPVLIFSVYFFLREKYLPSFLLLGTGFLIHPMTAIYFIVMQSAALLLNLNYIGIKKSIFYLFTLLIVSSPILIWKFLHSPPSLNLFHADTQWLEFLRLRSSHHIFPFSWSKTTFFHTGMVLFILFISWKYKPQAQHHRVIKVFVLSILSMCLAGTLFSEFIPVSVVLNIQLLRSFTFIYFLAAIYYSNFFVSELSSGKSVLYKLLIAFMSIGIFYGAGMWKYAFAAFFLFSIVLIISRTATEKYLIYLLSALVFISAFGIYLRRGNFTIGNRQEKQWIDVQQWAKANTTFSAAFIVPPYLEGFRIESQRTVYCDWKDGTLLNFNPQFGEEWFSRLEKLGYKKGGSLQNGYENLTEKDFMDIAEELSAKNKDRSVLLVVNNDRDKLGFHEVYRNDKFTIYKIRP